MRKNLLIIFMLFIISSLNVYALNLECKSNYFNVNDSLVCNIDLESDNLKSISFDIETLFDVTIKSDNDDITKNANHVLIAINDEKPIVVTLKKSSKTVIGNNNVSIKNVIGIDNDNNELKFDDINKTIVLRENNLSNDAFLTKIIVDGLELNDFSPNKFYYDKIYVNKQIIFIDAVRHDEKASVTGLGNVMVKPNETITRVLCVTAENGDVIEYTLEITNGINPTNDDVRPDVVSGDNRIKDLSLFYQNEKINLNFDSAKTIYNVVMPRSDMNEVTIRATLNDAKSSFEKGYEPKDYSLSYGDNKIELRVKAENGRVLTYLINVTRNDERSVDNSLLYLKINDKEIKLENNILEYFITLTHDVVRTKIEVVPSSEKAEVIYQDVNLVDGNNLPIMIKVVAENGSAREYKINVIRLKEEESKLVLENIKINGYNFPFQINSYVYDIDIGKDTKKLDIVVTPTLVNHEIEGNDALEDKSIIRIKVVDSDGLRTYTINVHKPVEDNYMIVYYFIFGIGVISFVASIIYAININKNKKK